MLRLARVCLVCPGNEDRERFELGLFAHFFLGYCGRKVLAGHGNRASWNFQKIDSKESAGQQDPHDVEHTPPALSNDTP